MLTLPYLYVSGPMSGRPEHNFPAFAEAARRLREARYPVVSPHEITLADGEVPGSRPWEDYLREDLIEMLRLARGVAVLPGWEGSRGAALEVYVAQQLGMEVRPVEEWVRSAVTVVSAGMREIFPLAEGE